MGFSICIQPSKSNGHHVTPKPQPITLLLLLPQKANQPSRSYAKALHQKGIRFPKSLFVFKKGGWGDIQKHFFIPQE